MHPAMFLPAMGELILVWLLVKENSKLKPVKLCLKKIDLVSYRAPAKGFVNIDMFVGVYMKEWLH